MSTEDLGWFAAGMAVAMGIHLVLAWWLNKHKRKEELWHEVHVVDMTPNHSSRIRTRTSVHNDGVSVMRRARLIKRRKV